MKLNKENLILIFIFLLGFYFRLIPFLHKQMWLDEVCVFEISNLSLKNIILLRHWDMAHPQLFYLFIHFWQKIGTDLQFLRLPGLILSIYSIIQVYLIGKLISKKISFALLSALSFSLSTWFINQAWELKTYNLVTFFILNSLLFLLRFVRFKKKKDLIIVIVSNILGFYSDYAFGWYFLSLGVTALALIRDLKIRKLLKPYFLMLAITFFAIIPQIILVVLNFSKLRSLQMNSTTYINVPITTDLIFNAIRLHSGLWQNQASVIKLILYMSLLGLILVVRSKRKLKFFITLILTCFFVPLILSTVISLVFPIFAPNFLLICSLIFIFGLPGFVFYKGKYLRFIYLFIYIYYLYLLINNQKLGVYYGFSKSEHLRNIIEKESNFGKIPSVIITVGKMGYVVKPLEIYYLKGYDRNQKTVKNYRLSEVDTIEDVNNLNIIRDYKQNYWLIYHKYEISNDYPIIKYLENKINCMENSCFRVATLE